MSDTCCFMYVFVLRMIQRLEDDLALAQQQKLEAEARAAKLELALKVSLHKECNF